MPSDQPRRRATLVFERTGREILIYSPDGSREAVHALNPTAALIWELCDGTHTLSEIERAIRRTFSVGPSHDLAADVRAVIAQFNQHSLLEV